MARLFKLEDLDNGNLFPLSNPPDTFFGDNAFQPCGGQP